jgi:hypothetical protein
MAVGHSRRLVRRELPGVKGMLAGALAKLARRRLLRRRGLLS